MSIVFSLLLVAAPNDGLPTFTAKEAEAARDAWSACLLRQTDQAAEFTADPSNVVADVAIELCDRELSDAKFKWRRYIIVASPLNLSDAQAEANAAEFYAELIAGKRPYLMGRASQKRQIEAMRKASTR